jgi:serine/threonine protein kinase
VDESATTRFEPLHASSEDHVAETRNLPGDGVPERMPDKPPTPGRDVRDAAPISDVCDEPQRAPTPLSAGNMLGTPRYMAPERWHGAPADVPSDLYALGVVLYELLVSTAPHPQTDRDELRRAILSGAVRPIHERAGLDHPVSAPASSFAG